MIRIYNEMIYLNRSEFRHGLLEHFETSQLWPLQVSNHFLQLDIMLRHETIPK